MQAGQAKRNNLLSGIPAQLTLCEVTGELIAFPDFIAKDLLSHLVNRFRREEREWLRNPDR